MMFKEEKSFIELEFYELSDGSKFVEERQVFGVEEKIFCDRERLNNSYSAEQQGIKSDFFSIENGRR